MERVFAAYDLAGAFRMAQLAIVEGPLDEDLLDRALLSVAERHALLRARIGDGPGGPRFEIERSLRSELEVRRPAPAEIAEGEVAGLAEELVRVSYDPGRPLWRCVLQPGPRPGGPHLLALASHHSLMDGLSGYRVLCDLVEACDDLHGGRPAPRLLPLPPALDDLSGPVRLRARLRYRLRVLRALALGRRTGLPLESAAGPGERRQRFACATTEPGVLDALRPSARARGATVGGVLAAAVLEAARGAFSIRDGTRISFSQQMSLRRALGVGPEVVGSYAVRIVDWPRVRARDDWWERARALTRALQQGVHPEVLLAGVAATRSGIRQLPEIIARAVNDGTTCGRTGALMLSNRGALPAPRSGSLAIRRCWSCSGNATVGDLVQVWGGGREDRLCLMFGWVEPLVSSATAGRFVAGVREALARAAGAAAPR